MELISITDLEKTLVQKSCNKTSKSIAEDVELIQEWLKKQPHLPQNLPYENFIEKILLLNKFSIQQSKEKIDAYFTLKNVYREFYKRFTITNDVIIPSKYTVWFQPLEKLGPLNEKIIIIYIRSLEGELFDFDPYIWISLGLSELILRYCYTARIRLIFNLKHFTLDMLKMVEISKFARYIALFVTAYMSQIISIDVINGPTFINLLLNPLKMIVKSKIMERIKMHKDLRALHESIPLEYLPEEYGGSAGNLQETMSKLDRLFHDHQDFFRDIATSCSKENLRVGKSKYGDKTFGIEGSFKKLNVD